MNIPNDNLKTVIITVANDFESPCDSDDESEDTQWIKHRWYVFVRKEETNKWEVADRLEHGVERDGYSALYDAKTWMWLWSKMDRIEGEDSEEEDSEDM